MAETITAKLEGIAPYPERTLFTFGGRKVSALPPAPDLKLGETYKLIIETVVRNGKTYYNLARNGKDGPYLIQPAALDCSNPKAVPDKELIMIRGGNGSDRAYSIVKESAKDALAIMKELGFEFNSQNKEIFSTLCGTLAIERFRKGGG